MSDTPFVSVIVPSRNSEDAIGRVIERLMLQTLPNERYEVIVVDDASTDDTAGAARRAGARVVTSPDWVGAFAARNLGLREARGDVIAFTDTDCRPHADWLEAALEDLETLGAELIGGHIEVTLSARPTIAELVDFARFLDQERSIREAGFAATANLVMRRAVFDRIGDFYEHSIAAGDVDLCLRATAAGFKLVYSPRPIVDHAPRTRARDVSRRGFRDGYGMTQWGPDGGEFARNLPVLWRRPGAWLPGALIRRKGIYGEERIHASGYRPSRIQRLQMALGEYVFVQLPLVTGSVAGVLKKTFGRGR